VSSGVLLILGLLAALWAALAALNSAFFTRGAGAPWLAAIEDRRERGRMRDPVYALLRREVSRVGQEYEATPYQSLRDMGDALTYREVVVDGMRLTFNAELVNVSRSGDLLVCIDAHAPEHRRFWRSWPSYQFHKRPDDSFYH
jgi:hypothetical protein